MLKSLSNSTSVRARLVLGTSVTAIGVALVMTVPSAAYAQAVNDAKPATAADAKNEKVEEIVVTGLRKSIESSIRVKKLSTSIVESITAEDVGKLPDVSIADSISRLPGVTSQRLEGRSDVLSIRGLGPDFSTALFNHREIVSVSDNRGFQYDQIPSELLNRVDVIKTPSADLVGQGLAGTVDMTTISPLSQAHRILSVSVRGELNGLKSLNPDVTNKGYRGALIYVDKFANDTIGISLGATAISSPVQVQQFQAWGYATLSFNNDKYGDRHQVTPGKNSDNDTFTVKPQYANLPFGTQLLGGAKAFATSNLLNRQSAFARFEYKPGSNFEMSFDALYSKYKTTEQQRGLEIPLGFSGDPIVSNVTTVNNLATNVTYSNVTAVQRNNYNKRDANTLVLGWNGKYDFSDHLKLTLDANYSRAKRHDFLLETYSGTGYQKSGVKDTVTIAQLPNQTYNFTTTLNYNDPNIFKLTDPQGWGYNGVSPVVQAGFLNAPDFKDEMKSFRANLDGDLHAGVLSSWELGVNYSDRSKTAAYRSAFLSPGPTLATTSLPLPPSIGNTSIAYLGIPAIYTYNPLVAYAALLPTFDNRPGSLARDYVVDEKVITGYVKVNIDGIIGALPLKGNFGVQVVYTNQSSKGSAATTTTTKDANGNDVLNVIAQPVTGGAKYTYALPSLNLSLEADHDFFIRLGLARTLARARQDQIAISSTFSVNNSNNNYAFSGNGGNPQLRPYIADGVDLSFEKYFAHGSGYLSVATFYKHISNFVDSTNFTYLDLSGVASQLLSPAEYTQFSGKYFAIITSPTNAAKGDMKGIEVALTLPFSLFTESLDGFGLIANGSYTDSAVALKAGKVTIPGLSKEVGTLQVFFEKYGLQVRSSLNYRSQFLGEEAGLSATPNFLTVAATTTLDAQVGYEFKEGFMKGFAIQFQAKNITNEPFVTYNPVAIGQTVDKRQVIDYQKYGPTYLLGATYKF